MVIANRDAMRRMEKRFSGRSSPLFISRDHDAATETAFIFC
jgi:hypothetical protein